MTPKSMTTITVERNGEELEVVVFGEVEPFHEGRKFGPPESCWPDEGGYAEFFRATYKGQPFTLTKEEIEDAECQLYEAYEQTLEDAYDMAESSKYDQWADK